MNVGKVCVQVSIQIFACPNHVSTLHKSTLFCSSPFDDEENEEQNVNLLKLDIQETHHSADIILLKNIDISIPMKIQEIKHRVKL